MAEREYDIVVLGASGFTGRLVVEYLFNAYGIDKALRWAIAGRNQAKLEGIRDEFASAALPIIIADSSDADSLNSLAARTSVLCTTVGPYARYGTPVVDACVRAGTDYCDLTGEVQWMAQIIKRYQQPAESSGARIVHTCGFDSIPFDMGNWFLQRAMHEQHGIYASRVKTRVGKFKGGASGGTIASMLNMMEDIKVDPALRKIVANPYALYPDDVPTGNDSGDQTAAIFDEDFQQWTAPFIMAAVNTRVVRRSNALLGLPWGQDFRYQEAVLTKSRWRATSASIASMAGMVAMAIGPTRRLAQRFLPKPGEGPDRAARESGFYEVFLHGSHPEHPDKTMLARVCGDCDPGYGSTSKMLAESAVCLAKDPIEAKGGIWTPASAMGAHLHRRLENQAGLTFELRDTAQL